MVSFMIFVGRFCLAVIFLTAGVNKFLNWTTTLAYMKGAGMATILGLQIGDMLPVLLVAAALVEIISGLAIIFGARTRLAASLLALFLIPTTLIFHNFWAVTSDAQQLQILLFFKNLAIFGGLLILVGSGPGGMSADAKRFRRSQETIAEEEPG